MNKLYKFVAERVIEAASEEEAKDKFAYESDTFAVAAECYEACPRCRGIKGGWLRECTCVSEQRDPKRPPELQTIWVGAAGEWRCTCGNTAERNGFYPCDEQGQLMEPDKDRWTGLYVCDRCGHVIQQETLAIVGTA